MTPNEIKRHIAALYLELPESIAKINEDLINHLLGVIRELNCDIKTIKALTYHFELDNGFDVSGKTAHGIAKHLYTLSAPYTELVFEREK